MDSYEILKLLKETAIKAGEIIMEIYETNFNVEYKEDMSPLTLADQNQIAEVVSIGSSLKGCFVAEQKADVYYRFGLTCEWDTAAMHCIAEQAGAIVRQMDHSELLYNRKDTLNAKGFYIVNNKDNIW